MPFPYSTCIFHQLADGTAFLMLYLPPTWMVPPTRYPHAAASQCPPSTSPGFMQPHNESSQVLHVPDPTRRNHTAVKQINSLSVITVQVLAPAQQRWWERMVGAGFSGTTSQLHPCILFLLFISPSFHYHFDHVTRHEHWSPQYNLFPLFPFAFKLPLCRRTLFSLSISFFLCFLFTSFFIYYFLLSSFSDCVPICWCPIFLFIITTAS